MDLISYRGMPMYVIQSLEWSREPVFDPSDTTYLFTRWKGSVVVTYNPSAIVFDNSVLPPAAQALGCSPFSGLPGIAGTTATQFPAATDAAIRAFLEQPRGQLIVRSNGNIVIQSPQIDPNTNKPRVCDADNGPKVRVDSISEIPGERTWKIHLVFETCVNESPSLNFFLSNRWSVSMDVAWDFTCTRTIRGVCTVRADLLRSAAIVAAPNTGLIDAVRDQFAAFSQWPNYQRVSVNVAVTPDGNSAHYVVVDKEQLFQKPGLANTNVPRFEVRETNWTWRGSVGRAAAGILNNNINLLQQMLNPFGSNPNPQATLQGNINAVVNNLPRRYKNCLVRAWGNRLQTRPQLTNLAMSIASSRLGNAGFFGTTTSEILVGGDTQNMVDVSWTISWDYRTQLGFQPVGAFAFALQQFGLGDQSFAQAIVQGTDMSLAPNTNNTPAGLGGSPILTQTSLPAVQVGSTASPNNPFFNDSGTRGTSLQIAVTQALEPFGTVPAAVP